MQNKFLYQILCAGLISLTATVTFAQQVEAEKSQSTDKPNQERQEPVQEGPAIDLTGRQAVDFPSRSSLDTLELAPLPGIYETNITGPVPLAQSVSNKDMPSERLLGRLTPEVFQEMAELERDNTFLKLQIQKETMKNDLEKLRANYRQARLDEIAKREDVVRTRIQWWQEQEKLRQDMEAQRAATEGVKSENNVQTENEGFEDDLDLSPDIEQQLQEENKPETTESVLNYALLGITGVQNTLTAKVRDTDTRRLYTVQIGDKLPSNVKVISITPTGVILQAKSSQQVLTFEDK